MVLLDELRSVAANTLNPTTRIIVIAASAEAPRETAPSFLNLRNLNDNREVEVFETKQ